MLAVDLFSSAPSPVLVATSSGRYSANWCAVGVPVRVALYVTLARASPMFT